MRKPNKETVFKPITEIVNYQDPEKYFCCGVVFSPETENEHFEGCPPYIEIRDREYGEEIHYFQVPEIVAYYAKTHPCYTMRGLENKMKQGEENMKRKIKELLGI